MHFILENKTKKTKEDIFLLNIYLFIIIFLLFLSMQERHSSVPSITNHTIKTYSKNPTVGLILKNN